MSKPTLTNLMDIYDAWRDHDLDRLASYLPADFSHSLNIPCDMIPAGGVREGKAASIARLGVIADDFEILQFDTHGLIVQNDKAAVESRSTIVTVKPA